MNTIVLNPKYSHLRKGEVRNCEVCGKQKYYKRAFLKLRNPRACSVSHSAIIRHREGWTPRTKSENRSVRQDAYRYHALKHYGARCMRCGFDKDARLLDVDHIDEDRTNNVLDNLQVLCVMCHAMYTRQVIIR